jgi:hypothetical protein
VDKRNNCIDQPLLFEELGYERKTCLQRAVLQKQGITSSDSATTEQVEWLVANM